MTLLGFIPGIGDLALIDRGVEAIEAVSGLAKSARLSRLLSTEDKLGNLFAGEPIIFRCLNLPLAECYV